MTDSLGIAGSGRIACGLARAAADTHDVVLWARSNGSAERACDAVEDAAHVITDLAELGDCDLVVEAIAEEAEAKGRLYEQLGGVLADDAVIATTTSSLSVAGLAVASGRPDRFAALHVFNPVEKMALVEVSFAAEASDETRRRVHRLCEALGKTAVEVPDAPGFVVNRLLFPYLFDAVRLLERESLNPATVDSCMTLGAGHPIGPLALLDFVGLDVAAAIGDSIGVEVPDRVRSLIDEGRLGKKVRAGFYEYEPAKAPTSS